MKKFIIPHRNYSDQDSREFVPLVSSSPGIWAIRYLWIQHRFDNNEFLSNYFLDGNKKNLNLRAQTIALSENWNLHNRIFEQSAANGDLVWRFKVLNIESSSIDMVEVWRSREILDMYFDRNKEVIISGNIWHPADRDIFAEGLWNAGFDIRTWIPYETISSTDAILYYNNFLSSVKNKSGCILNTPWNKDLNPIM